MWKSPEIIALRSELNETKEKLASYEMHIKALNEFHFNRISLQKHLRPEIPQSSRSRNSENSPFPVPSLNIQSPTPPVYSPTPSSVVIPNIYGNNVNKRLPATPRSYVSSGSRYSERPTVSSLGRFPAVPTNHSYNFSTMRDDLEGRRDTRYTECTLVRTPKETEFSV